MERPRYCIKRIAVVVQLLLVVAVILLIPVVVSLVDVALRLILLDLTKTGKLAVPLLAKRVVAVEALRCAEDVVRVVL